MIKFINTQSFKERPLLGARGFDLPNHLSSNKDRAHYSRIPVLIQSTVLKENESMKKREKKDLRRIIELLTEGYSYAEQIAYSISDYFDGDLLSLYEYMIHEGLMGKTLEYDFIMKHEKKSSNFEEAVISFVLSIDIKRKMSLSSRERVTKRIFPKFDSMEGKAHLTDSELDKLQNMGIYCLLASRLKQLEESDGITAKEVYEEINEPQTTFCEWRRGTVPHKLFSLVKLIRFLRRRLKRDDIDLEWLITCTDDVKGSAIEVIDNKERKELETLRFQNASYKLQLEHQQDLLDQSRN